MEKINFLYCLNKLWMIDEDLTTKISPLHQITSYKLITSPATNFKPRHFKHCQFSQLLPFHSNAKLKILFKPTSLPLRADE